jgi:hypothetical protein
MQRFPPLGGIYIGRSVNCPNRAAFTILAHAVAVVSGAVFFAGRFSTFAPDWQFLA